MIAQEISRTNIRNLRVQHDMTARNELNNPLDASLPPNERRIHSETRTEISKHAHRAPVSMCVPPGGLGNQDEKAQATVQIRALGARDPLTMRQIAVIHGPMRRSISGDPCPRSRLRVAPCGATDLTVRQSPEVRGSAHRVCDLQISTSIPYIKTGDTTPVAASAPAKNGPWWGVRRAPTALGSRWARSQTRPAQAPRGVAAEPFCGVCGHPCQRGRV